ncbi:hypothetical protein WKG92_19435 [Pantoea agglomerans]|uniref:hypothetical protein n=1 Tax=Enterobacter agglomerans TaxID=549 RepID=UPI003C7B5656
MLFTAEFFTSCPTFQHYARREKTRHILSKGLVVFADMALKVGSLKVPKGDFMALSGMSERTLNYYGGIKGISYLFRKTASEGRSRLNAKQVENLRKIGIGAIALGHTDALLIMKEDPDVAMRRDGWPTGCFVMLESDGCGEDFLVFTSATGGSEHYQMSLVDMTTADWVRLN